MWILIKKTYISPLGSFHRGQKYDLPERIINQLPKKSYVKTRAPWDENKDEKVIAADKLRTEATAAKLAATYSAQTAEQLRRKADQLVHPAQAAQDEDDTVRKNAEAAVSIVESGKATEQQKFEAAELVRISERAATRNDKAQAELLLAIAEARLAKLAAEDAEREAKSLCKKAGIKFDESETKQAEGTAGAEPQSAEDATDTKRQADEAEQAGQ